MKKILLTLFLCYFGSNLIAQRYKTQVFDSVVVTADNYYGYNFGVNNDSTALYLDIYEPANDTPNVLRPLLVLAHGGSFVQGNRKASDIVAFCTAMAKRGYVCASIQYRLGVNVFAPGTTFEKEFAHAVWRGTQDGRSAVRWFRSSIANGNPYKINTNEVYAGGISAGGVLGMHLACLDQASEVAQTVIDTVAIGGIEGNSGNPGYSWKVKGVINLCGAISNVSWMQNNMDVKLISMHGTNDQTVPYKTDYFYFLSAPVAILQGSFSVDSAATKMGIHSDFYTFQGAPHVPFSSNSTYMDTTINYVAESLYNIMFNSSGTIETMAKSAQLAKVYPNPAQNRLFIELLKNNEAKLTITNMQGATVFVEPNADGVIDISHLNNGIYFLKIEQQNKQQLLKFIKN